MNKKLQVFVSSTYIDLKEERQAAVQAIIPMFSIVLYQSPRQEFIRNRENFVFEKNNTDLYRKFKTLVLNNIYKIVKNIYDLRLAVYCTLKNYDVLIPYINWEERIPNPNVRLFTQKIYDISPNEI